MTTVEALSDLLPDHLQKQRWFSSAAPAPQVRVVDAERWPSDGPECWWLMVESEAAIESITSGGAVASGPLRHQVLVGIRPEDELDFIGDHERCVLGVVGLDDSGRSLIAYDALCDPTLAMLLLEQMLPGRGALTVRALPGEQSNTSLVFDEQVIVKVFRRIADGDNPDVSSVAALVEGGFAHVPGHLATLQRDDAALAVARPFLNGATDGWHLASTSLRVVFAEHVPSSTSGGDFGPEARALGAVTGELHVAMARAFGSEPFSIGEFLDVASAGAEASGPGVPSEAILERHRRAADVVASSGSAGASMRIHGDLHLGQVLRADAGWFVVDFEGEPTRAMVERVRPTTPLRDVAGMLRSFHYAAAVAMREQGDRNDLDPAAAAEWEARARSEFLAGYRSVEGIEALVPAGEAFDELLAACELDKALYEIEYERAFRPDWMEIPMGAVERLLT